MNTYVAFVTYTDQGVRQIKETLQRVEQVRQLVERMGGRWVTFIWTMGRFDAVSIIEAPDDATAQAIALAVESAGNVRLETARGFTSEEMAHLLVKLG
jgi:uncharacterized protein with GYD domain